MTKVVAYKSRINPSFAPFWELHKFKEHLIEHSMEHSLVWVKVLSKPFNNTPVIVYKKFVMPTIAFGLRYLKMFGNALMYISPLSKHCVGERITLQKLC